MMYVFSTTPDAVRYSEKKKDPPLEGLKDLAPELLKHNLTFRRVGSEPIVGLEDSVDVDYLILDTDNKIYDHLMHLEDWHLGGSDVSGADFVSWRNIPDIGDMSINAILTQSKEYYNKFLEAQITCEDYKVRNKSHRIEVFDYVFGRDGKPTKERFTDILLGKASANEYGAF